MKISENAFRQYAMQGKDSVMSDDTVISIGIMIIIHGFLLCITTHCLFNEMLVLSICFSAILFLVYYITFLVVRRKIGAVKNGYNFLILSLFGFINSIICLFTSMTICYNKLHSIKDIIIMPVVFLISAASFYFLVWYRISKFKPKVNESNKSTTHSVGKTPYMASLTLSVVFIAGRMLQQTEQSKIVLFLIILFYLLSILYIFITPLIIKFIYLKKHKLI